MKTFFSKFSRDTIFIIILFFILISAFCVPIGLYVNAAASNSTHLGINKRHGRIDGSANASLTKIKAFMVNEQKDGTIYLCLIRFKADKFSGDMRPPGKEDIAFLKKAIEKGNLKPVTLPLGD